MNKATEVGKDPPRSPNPLHQRRRHVIYVPTILHGDQLATWNIKIKGGREGVGGEMLLSFS